MSNVTIGVIEDIDTVKGWSKVLQTPPGCQLEIHDSQLEAMQTLYKRFTTVRVLKEEKHTLSLETLERCKYCDIRIHTYHPEGELESRLIWSPSRIAGNERINFGAMVIYNPTITDIIGKFSQIAVPIYWLSYPSSKIPKIVLPDTDNIFVPFQDQISHNRFISESNKIRIQENAPRLLTYFNDYLYKVWAPALVDNFRSSYQLPKRPKKPDIWICNKNPEIYHEWIFNMCVKSLFPNLKCDINNKEELMFALMSRKDDEIERFNKLSREIIGSKVYDAEIDRGRELLRTIAPETAKTVDKMFDEVECSEKSELKPKEYEDSLDGFFEMLKDM